MASLLKVGPGQIDAIKAHLASGNQVAILTAYKTTTLDKRHLDYIRADKDGKGYRAGWPGKSSVYVFNHQIAFVPVGHRL